MGLVAAFDDGGTCGTTTAEAVHDLSLCPLVMDLLARVPDDCRVGPLIVDETAGRPYAEHAYAREWRVIARAAGIPDAVWKNGRPCR